MSYKMLTICHSHFYFYKKPSVCIQKGLPGFFFCDIGLRITFYFHFKIICISNSRESWYIKLCEQNRILHNLSHFLDLYKPRRFDEIPFEMVIFLRVLFIKLDSLPLYCFIKIFYFHSLHRGSSQTICLLKNFDLPYTILYDSIREVKFLKDK